MVSDEEGRLAVALARATLGERVGSGGGPAPAVDVPPFSEKRGVFVTLRTHPSGALRGCIGYPLAHRPLAEGIRESALAAATQDPRFAPVGKEEVDHLTVEVSILSAPERITASEPARRVDEVIVGRDGLIVEGYGTSGLLLPQVAPEEGWDARQLLEGTCEKAGLPRNGWKDPRVQVFRFSAEVFAEGRPGGPVHRESRAVRSSASRPAR